MFIFAKVDCWGQLCCASFDCITFFCWEYVIHLDVSVIFFTFILFSPFEIECPLLCTFNGVYNLRQMFDDLYYHFIINAVRGWITCVSERVILMILVM